MSNEGMIRKASTFEIFNHWLLAISFFILALTGFAYLFHLETVSSLFGSLYGMRTVHRWSGVVFSVSLFFTLFSYLPVSITITKNDLEWLFKGGGYLGKHVPLEDPPQDKLNAAQKIFYLTLVLLGIAIIVSGFVIWLVPAARKNILLSHFFHNFGFDVLLAFVAWHIYFATLANPGTLRIMLNGKVPVEWARRRYTKWVQKMGY